MSLFLLFEESSAEELIENNSDITPKNNPSSSIGCGDNCDECHIIVRQSESVEKPIANTIKIAWSFVLVIMASFFLAAAYVQHNDPDPYIWMAAYLVPCVVNMGLTFLTFWPSSKSSRRLWKIVNWIITVHICYCYVLGFWTLVHYIHRQMWSDEVGKIIKEMVSEPDMHFEEAKELIGLCLVIAWLSFVSNRNFIKFGIKGILFASLLTALPIVSWILVEKLEEDRDGACF